MDSIHGIIGVVLIHGIDGVADLTDGIHGVDLGLIDGIDGVIQTFTVALLLV